MWVEKGVVTEYLKSVDEIPDGEYWTVEEYSYIFNIKPNTVKQWCHRGQIEHYILKGKLVIPAGTVPKNRNYLSTGDYK